MNVDLEYYMGKLIPVSIFPQEMLHNNNAINGQNQK